MSPATLDWIRGRRFAWRQRFDRPPHCTRPLLVYDGIPNFGSNRHADTDRPGWLSRDAEIIGMNSMSRWRVRSGHAWEPWRTPNRSQTRSLLPICIVAVLYAVCEGGKPTTDQTINIDFNTRVQAA
ncbi:hypothetical protein-transmembrane prediction [Rhodopirellula baltica SH 1]|uniref:Uncharacterized protein n=2 Tax=Rhodopirellula baltica TaxID=265606 RepID=Q7UW97_RHOBA|nr:hypothetical protein-transmembrane prediction [Rhodopirellula baltica SH 1]